jgi:hypothetical protein
MRAMECRPNCPETSLEDLPAEKRASYPVAEAGHDRVARSDRAQW